MTSAVLLKILLTNPELNGISHIVMDNILEEDENFGIVTFLIKQHLKNRSKLHVIFMSSSYYIAELIKEYFSQQQTQIKLQQQLHYIDIPNRLTSKTLFLEEIINTVSYRGYFQKGQYCNLVTQIISWIFQRSSGQVLCILPGLEEIRSAISVNIR